MTVAFQKLLPIRVELRLPTVDLAGARAILDQREDEIKDLVDEKIIPAWNIGRDNSTRRELRLLTRAVRNHADDKPVELDNDFITRLLYGPAKPVVWGRDFYRAWNCDSGTMINLCRAGVLKVAHGPLGLASDNWSRGRNGTPAITWASAVAFLNSRRIK